MKVKDKVERHLKESQKFRDSDRWLLMRYWHDEGLHLTPEQREAFLHCTTAETITRARRTLKKQYPASPEVDNQRFIKFSLYKNGYMKGDIT